MLNKLFMYTFSIYVPEIFELRLLVNSFWISAQHGWMRSTFHVAHLLFAFTPLFILSMLIKLNCPYKNEEKKSCSLLPVIGLKEAAADASTKDLVILGVDVILRLRISSINVSLFCTL